MKKKIAIILAILTLTSITACGQSNGNNSSSKTESSYSSSDNSKSEKSSHKESTSNTEDTTLVEETTKKPESSSTKKDVSTLDGIEAAVSEDVENTISGLEKEFDSLKSEIDTYDKYLQNTSEIEDFYNKIVKTNEDVCIRLYEYALEYANIVVNDYAALEDADVIISSLGNIQLQHNAGEDRFAEFPFTREAVYQVSQELKKLDFKGILLVISNPVDAVSALYQEFTGWPRERVIGTGTLLDTARMKAAVGDDLSVNPKSVSGYNLGEHGNSQFTAWSQVKVKGQDITELTSEEERQNLFMASMKGGHKVFYGKGYTSYGIASAALRLVTIILSDAQEEVAVSSYQEAYQTYLGYPVILGRQGVAAPVHLFLSAEENRLLEESANLIRNRVQEAVAFLKEKYVNTRE